MTAAGTYRISSTLELAGVAGVSERFDLLRDEAPATVRIQLNTFGRIVSAGFRGRPLVLFTMWGGLKPDLMGAAALRLLGSRRPAVVMVGETWQPSPGWRGRLERLVVRAADGGIDRFLPPGDSEVTSLLREWGVSPVKVAPCRFFVRPGATA